MHTIKVIDIVKNDPVTGVQYGLVDKNVDEKNVAHQVGHAIRRHRQIQQTFIRTSRTQHK